MDRVADVHAKIFGAARNDARACTAARRRGAWRRDRCLLLALTACHEQKGGRNRGQFQAKRISCHLNSHSSGAGLTVQRTPDAMTDERRNARSCTLRVTPLWLK